MKRVTRVLAGAVAAGLLVAMLAGAMAYGFFVHRDHRFPYHLALRVWGRINPPAGRRYHVFKSAAARKALSLREVEQLAALPYLRGYKAAGGRSSVLIHDHELAQEGWNFLVSGHAPEATLMDMDGAILRTWATDVRKAFPGKDVRGRNREGARYFRAAAPLPDGGIVAMFEDVGLVGLGPSAEVRWSWAGAVHHELYVDDTQAPWVLTHAPRNLPDLLPDEPAWDDYVTQLTPDGHLVRQISLLDSLRRSPYGALLARLPHQGDLLHANNLQVLDGSLAGQSPIFRRGNVLVCLRNIDSVAVVDPDQGRVIWALSGPWHRQHSARFLTTGHLVLFDNLGSLRLASRVLELDPFTQQMTWTFGGGQPGQDLFSETAGSVRRLSDGNTLICESNAGRAIEVTPDGRIAWEFVNPHRAGKKKELIANVYDLRRLPTDKIYLPHAAAPSPPSPDKAAGASAAGS